MLCFRVMIWEIPHVLWYSKTPHLAMFWSSGKMWDPPLDRPLVVFTGSLWTHRLLPTRWSMIIKQEPSEQPINIHKSWWVWGTNQVIPTMIYGLFINMGHQPVTRSLNFPLWGHQPVHLVEAYTTLNMLPISPSQCVCSWKKRLKPMVSLPKLTIITW